MYIRKVTFRDADFSDAEQMTKIEQKCFVEELQWDKEAIEAELKSEFNHTRIIEVDGEMAGFIMLELEPDKPAYIATLDIDPLYQRNGYGNALKEWAEIQAKQAGRTTIETHVSTRNVKMYRINFKRGYTTVRFEPQFYANGEDALLMRKVL